MRILYHHRTRGAGVEGVHVREMIRALRSLGHTVDVLSPPGVALFEEAMREAAPATAGSGRGPWRHISRQLPQLWFELLELGYGWYAGLRLGRALRRRRYDMIYERYAFLNWAAAAGAKRYRVPLILEINHTLHTPLPRTRTRWLKTLTEKIEREAIAITSGIVVVSSQLQRHLVEGYGVQASKVAVIPNAADPKVFDPEKVRSHDRLSERLNGQAVVGFTGRFLPWHGLDLLVKAMPEVLKRRPDTYFLFVGSGPEQTAIEAEIARLGLTEHAWFLGEVAHVELPAYLAAFDVAVQPHVADYASPMKVFEYMAMGKPTVAVRSGTLPEILTDGEEGVLFEPQNALALAQGILRLLEDPALRSRLGAASRQKILKEHNWINNARLVLRLLCAVTGSPERSQQ